MIATLYRYPAGGRFLLHGFLVTPDHGLMLFSPGAALEQSVGLIKGGLSFAVRDQYKGSVWQDGYYTHHVVNEQDYWSQLAYVAANPERRCLDEHSFMHTHPGYFMHTHPGYEIDPMPPHLGG